MKIKSIGIVAWPGKSAQLAEVLARISQWSRTHKEIRVVALDGLSTLHTHLALGNAQALRKCDALVAIGGDGTVLSAARLALGTKAVILGVNTGRLGFLAEYREEELESSLDLLLLGKFKLCPRLMLDYEIFSGRRKIFQDTVLNEVQIQAIEPSRMVDLDVQLDGSHLTEYWADSLLISTPTGSTAYNLSAGGPILHPATDVLVLNPVNPCSLSVRPLVVAAHSRLLITDKAGQSVRIMVDGHAGPNLEHGQRLVLRKSHNVTRFVQPQHSGFVEALREKLGWTGKPKLKP